LQAVLVNTVDDEADFGSGKHKILRKKIETRTTRRSLFPRIIPFSNQNRKFPAQHDT
jgi:hypothetical protein